MKTTVLILLISMVLLGCQQEKAVNVVSSETKMEDDKLILQLKLNQGESVAYGNIYIGEVVEVTEGVFSQDIIYLMILAKKDGYAEFLNTHLSPKTVRIEFRKKLENVEKRYLPMDGFVDEQGNAWEVEAIN